MENDGAFIAAWEFLSLVYSRTSKFEQSLLAARKWREIEERSEFDFGYEDQPAGTWDESLTEVASTAAELEATFHEGSMEKALFSLENLFPNDEHPLNICSGLRALSQNVLLEISSKRRTIEKIEFWEKHGSIALGFRIHAETALRNLEGLREVRAHALRNVRERFVKLPQVKTPPSIPPSNKPVWDELSGMLKLNGIVVRSVVRKARNVRKLLAGFHECNWDGVVDSPFTPDEKGKETLRDTVRQVNRGLNQILFFCEGNGVQVGWRLLEVHDRARE